ncbi:hypothetical protein ACF9IK_13965 [Kitasatospora hibisci]|uniref:hypothetical protein n=1 Tax=Kitasatospora hibisci TaxID=3369522 RepID=UPI003754065C
MEDQEMSPVASVAERDDIFDLDIEFVEAGNDVRMDTTITMPSQSIYCGQTGPNYTCYCSYVPTQCGSTYGFANAPGMCAGKC